MNVDVKMWDLSVLLSFIMPICQALPNRTTWHLNATDYLQEIGVADLRLKTVFGHRIFS